MTTERDWERLGRAFAEARAAAGLKQTQVAELLHVSRTPIQAVERGRQPNGNPFTKVTATMRAYARLVGWTEDSPQLILDGQEPERATQQSAALPGEPNVSEKPKYDLPPAVDFELRSGKTLESTVVHLGSEDADTRIIVVLKGAEDLGEEELEKLWQEWRRARRHLQGIASDADAVKDS